jgi:hypothetical protein
MRRGTTEFEGCAARAHRLLRYGQRLEKLMQSAPHILEHDDLLEEAPFLDLATAVVAVGSTGLSRPDPRPFGRKRRSRDEHPDGSGPFRSNRRSEVREDFDALSLSSLDDRGLLDAVCRLLRGPTLSAACQASQG